MLDFIWFLFITIPKFLTFALLAFRWYIEITMGLAHIPKDKRLDGKVALITGATSGIGYETALEFAKRGATIILASRDGKKVIQINGIFSKHDLSRFYVHGPTSHRQPEKTHWKS